MSYFSLMSTLYTLNYHSSWLFGIIIDVYKPRLHYLHSYPVILHGQWILSRRSRNVPLRYLMNILHSNSTRSGIFRNTVTDLPHGHVMYRELRVQSCTLIKRSWPKCMYALWLIDVYHLLVKLGLWLRLECSLDSLSIVSTDHQIDRGLSVSLRLYEMCHVLVIV